MSRRGHGEGSIFQRQDGRWVAIVDHGYRDGKRHRKSIYGETRKEVSDQLKTELRSQQLGLPATSGRLTVGTWLKQWLKQQEPPATRPKSYEDYESHVNDPDEMSRSQLSDAWEQLRADAAQVAWDVETLCEHLRAVSIEAQNMENLVAKDAA